MTAPSLTICDLSPPCGDKGGGIRTLYGARIDWFSRQARHPYVLISPERAQAVARQHGSWDDAVARHVAVYETMAGGDVEARRCSA